MNHTIIIRKMSEYDRDVSFEVSKVFVDGYYRELSLFTGDKIKLIRTFRHAFCPDVIYVAELDHEIVGMLGCSNRNMRAMKLDRDQLKSHLGFWRGHLAYHLMKQEFNTPLSYPDRTAYIECVATMEKARGRGVATALIQYVLHQLPYDQFILEVTDTNQTAYRLYKRLGFVEFDKKNEKLARLKGFHERIYMHWP
mgnify:CR=1 FL=1